MPRAQEILTADLAEAEEQVDSRILRADEARGEGRWEDCLKWLEDAVSAVRDRKRLAREITVAKVMLENND